MKASIFILLLLFAVLSCHKEVMLTGSTNNFPTFQSFIVAGSDTLTVKVATLTPYSNDSVDSAKPITGLTMYINNYLLKEQSAGVYCYSSKDLQIHPNDTFNLNVTYKNTKISSKTIIPAKPLHFMISSDTVSITQQTTAVGFGNHNSNNFDANTNAFQFTWDNPLKDYHYLVIQLLDTARISINTYFTNNNGEIKTSTPVNQDNAYNLSQRSLIYYGKYQVVLYKINKEYYNLLQTSNLNSNTMTNPPSNITNGWGIFTGMSTDTLYFTVLKR